MNQDKYIGRLLDDRYEILEVLGVGGMAVVYKARCRRLNRMVAVKILKDEYSQDEEFRRRFHAESQAVAMLSHPNIVSVYDVSSVEGSDYIVMELIEGITLKYYMEKKGVLNWKETLHFAMQIAKALEHAHSRGIVHRDIKPHNVMVLKNGSVKVADFGIAQIMSTSQTMTQEALGSVHYISPEQAKGSRVDSRSDVYSLGIVMYEMISGRVPYDGETPLSVVMQHINGNALLPSALNPNTPRALEQIIMKAIEHQPKDRYATATAMLYDMDEFRKNPTMVFPERQTVEQTVISEEPMVPEAPAQPQPTPQQQTIAQKKVQPERKAPEPRHNHTATIAIAACAVVGLVAVIILLLLLPSCQKEEVQLTVPNLVGQYFDQLAQPEGLQIEQQGSEHSAQYPAGQIMYQYPEAGTQVEPGSKVFVIISLGLDQFQLEDMTGKKLNEVKAYLESVGLELDPKPVDDNNVPENTVLRTEPAAGELVSAGQSVTVYYKERPRAVVPRVSGLMLEEAQTKLEDEGFWIFEVKVEKNNLPKGTVLRLNPDVEGKEYETAQKLTIYVSKGKPMMEDLSGKTKDEVAQFFTELDLPLNISYKEENSIDVEKDLVIRTEPEVGTELKENQSVTIYLSAGPGMVKVPDLRGKTAEQAREALNALGIRNIREKEIEGVLAQGLVEKLSAEIGTEVDATKQFVVYISKGQKGLDELSGTTLEDAVAALEALKLDLDVKQVGVEDETVPAGVVLRTEPAAGTILTVGQEITLHYSLGPTEAVVPEVEGDTLEMAQQKLTEAGFKNLTVEQEHSDRPVGQVLALSVTEGEKVSLDAAIIILVSKGPDDQEITIYYDFTIPANENPVKFTVLCGLDIIVENMELEPDQGQVTLELTGSGTQEYEIYIDGVLYGTETVEFASYE